ncbi:MAG: hypothetical protein LBQ18_08830 [Campylobacteraceae bacterium]|jgi:hypothetical protein|nr:hypothetical protein [Campylobacteraceae bacterium]
MKNSFFKLLVSVLAFGFLVGCGGGGGGSDSETALPSVESSFSDFSNSYSDIYRGIGYDYVTEEDGDKFVDGLLAEGFSCDSSTHECYKDDPYAGIDVAYVRAGKSTDAGFDDRDHVGLLELGSSADFSTALFNTIFPAVNGKKAFVYIHKVYAASLSTALSTYANNLRGFTFDSASSHYIKDGGDFIYAFGYSSDGLAARWVVLRKDWRDNIAALAAQFPL